MAFKLRSPAFGPGGEIPLKYTGDGTDVSPPLRWTDPPEGTKSFALTVDDREDPPQQNLDSLGALWDGRDRPGPPGRGPAAGHCGWGWNPGRE
jgi:phosphatidylethanolamine-binding protein (PEBP) family uncharacterized protein